MIGVSHMHETVDLSSRPCCRRLDRSVAATSKVPSWSAIVAENIYWASFEKEGCSSLAEAMAALENGLGKLFQENG